MKRKHRLSTGITAAMITAALLCSAAPSFAQLNFSKAFVPATIGPGSVSTLVFTIENPSAVPDLDLAFTDNLPAGVTIADPALANNSCNGDLAAPAGGSVISLTNGLVGGFNSCTITVDVTAAAPGVHMNVSGNLTSAAGDAGSASADLTVAADRPGFSKAFLPSSVNLGARSTLVFTIDNSANPALMTNLTFTDALPVGVVIADPANSSTTCTGGILTAEPGTQVITYGAANFGDASVGAGAICTVSVDVVTNGIGALDNSTGELTASEGFTSRACGKATARLIASADTVSLIKAFTTDPTPPGGTVDLEFTILNRDRDAIATNITFTDDISFVSPVPTALGLPLTDPCGPGSLLSETAGVLTLSGATLAPEASCTFTVPLNIAITTTPGSYPNTTSSLTADLNGSPVAGSPASDMLFVRPAPILSKQFLDATDLTPDPVVGGGNDVVMRFSITNSSPTSTAADIAFIDELTSFMPFPVSVDLPTAPCGAGSNIALIFLDTESQGLSLTGGTLAPLATCVFDVTLAIPLGFPAGAYVNTTEEISASIDGLIFTGSPASDEFQVVATPQLLKAFTNDPVEPGDTVTLQFTLEHDANAAGDATAISFTDDLAATLSGLTALGLPMTDLCGPGNGSMTGLSGDSLISIDGISLAPGESCTTSVTLAVPGSASAGSYPNTTSSVSATVLGAEATGYAASDNLRIGGLELAKTFTDDPVLPGGQVTLEFTISNSSGSETATNISFQDALSGTLGGLAVDPASVPIEPCGIGSQVTLLSGNTTILLANGTLAPLGSCTFNLTLDVPAGAVASSYSNTTSSLSAVIGGSNLSFGAASDILVVEDNYLSFDKEFIDDPTPPGDTTTLRFTLHNLDPSNTVEGITFTDDLDAALTGLAAVGLPFAACGGTVSGNSLITFVGGSISAGGACQFDVPLQLPAVVAAGTIVTNTTSEITGTIGGLPVTGGVAHDDLHIQNLQFSSSFDGPTTATGTAVLSFSITNLSATEAANDLGFSDDLDAVVPGLVASGLPLSNVCGPGSQLSGTSFLTLAGGNIPPGGSCSFDVNVLVPASAAAGSFGNTTSDLTQAGLSVSPPASSTLVIEPPPVFSKQFTPSTIAATGTSTLEFTIDNSGSALAAADLDFTDDLPAGLVVSTNPSAGTNCTGGVLTAIPGTTSVSYTGGAVGAGASCSLQVNVTALIDGSMVNTSGALTSSSGISGTASATLLVTPATDVSITKSDGVTEATPGSSIVYTIVAVNNGPSADPSVQVTDTFPSILACAFTSLSSGGATGNSSGSGNISDSLAMPAGSSVVYTANCTIDSAATGTLSNTASILPSITELNPGNNSATDSNTALVPQADVQVSMTDGVNSAIPGQDTLTYIITASNDGPSDESSANLVDAFPSDLSCSFTSVAIGGASGNTPAGSGNLNETLDLPAGSQVNYTATCTIDPSALGTLSNTVTISGTISDPNASNNSATDDDTALTPEADLNIEKVAGADPTVAGEQLVYTVSVNNTGPSDALGVMVADALPAGTTLVSTAGCQEDPNGAPTCTLGVIAAGGSAGFTITVATDPSLLDGEILTNTATVTATTPLVNTVDDSASENTTISTQSDLTITKIDDVDPVLAGNQLVYTIRVDNLGPSDAQGITVSEILPADVNLVETIGCAEDPAGVPTCTLGTLAFDAYSEFEVVVAVDPNTADGAILTNQATTSASSGLINIGDDVATEETTVGTGADLVLDMTDQADPLGSGDDIVYTLTVTNQGPSAATGVTITDALPAGLSLVSTSGCAEDPAGTPTCTVGALDVDQSVQVEITASVTTSDSGTIINSASVTADDNDPDPSNNSAEESTTVDLDAPVIDTIGVSSGDGVLDDCETLSNSISQVMITFSERVSDPSGNSDPDDVTNPANYRFLSPGPDQSFDTDACGAILGDDQFAPISGVSYDDATRTATVDLESGLPGTQHRLLVCGSTSIVDLVGNPLDGNHDGTGGDDFRLGFRVDPENLLKNGNFDCDLETWNLLSSTPGEIDFSVEDVDQSNESGSASIRQLGVNTDFSIDQCVDMQAGLGYAMNSTLRLDSSSYLSYRQSCIFFTGPGCTGSAISESLQTQILDGSNGTWIPISGDLIAPATASSARCSFGISTASGGDFEAWLDALSLRPTTTLIFEDGFEVGNTSAWSATTAN